MEFPSVAQYEVSYHTKIIVSVITFEIQLTIDKNEFVKQMTEFRDDPPINYLRM